MDPCVVVVGADRHVRAERRAEYLVDTGPGSAESAIRGGAAAADRVLHAIGSANRRKPRETASVPAKES